MEILGRVGAVLVCTCKYLLSCASTCFSGLSRPFVLLAPHPSAARCKSLLMTGEATGSGAREGERTRDGEAFPRCLQSCPLFLSGCKWSCVSWRRVGECEQGQPRNYTGCCHHRPPSQASYTQARADSKGLCPLFPVAHPSLCPCFRAFLHSVVVLTMPTLLGSKLGTELHPPGDGAGAHRVCAHASELGESLGADGVLHWKLERVAQVLEVLKSRGGQDVPSHCSGTSWGIGWTR